MNSKHKMMCLIGVAGFLAAGVASMYDGCGGAVIAGLTVFVLTEIN